jgi:hypothetical protein
MIIRGPGDSVGDSEHRKATKGLLAEKQLFPNHHHRKMEGWILVQSYLPIGSTIDRACLY